MSYVIQLNNSSRNFPISEEKEYPEKKNGLQLKLTIPKKPKIKEFLTVESVIESSLKIHEFIHKSLYGKKMYDHPCTQILLKQGYNGNPFIISEMARNSYDSFAKKYSHRNDPLILKKDKINGIYFDYPSFSSRETTAKKSQNFLGGHGIGLQMSIDDIENANGEMLIKNRKKKGCAIYIKYPRKSIFTYRKF